MSGIRSFMDKLGIFWSCIWALVIHSIRVQFKTKKLGYFWDLIDPIAQISLWIVIFSLWRGQKEIHDMSTFLFLATGITGFYLFNKIENNLPQFLKTNKKMSFFVNVNQMNILIAGFVKSAVNMTLVSVIVFLFASMSDYGFFPEDPLSVVNSCIALLLFGFAFGSFNAMAIVLVPLYDKFLGYVWNRMRLFISGAIIPLDAMPQTIQKYVLWNPVAQGIDQLRSGWSYTYDSNITSNGYVLTCALFGFFFALTLGRKAAAHRQKNNA